MVRNKPLVWFASKVSTITCMLWIRVGETIGSEMSTSFINTPPLLLSIKPRNSSFPLALNQRTSQTAKIKGRKSSSSKSRENIGTKNINLAVQIGALLATVAEPAIAVTGVNNEEDLTWVLIQVGISAFLYFLVAPPIIMNWLRIRWYRRNLLEMYVQFMFVFMFFPGVLLWAPFLNFRKFPRDPSMKYPWDKPENPDEIKGGFLKWPYATPEDYD